MISLINDDNAYKVHNPPQGLSKGRIPRDFSKVPYGSMPNVPAFGLPIFSKQELADRANDKIKGVNGASTNRKIIQAGGVIALDQNGTNYCWINAVIQMIQCLRAIQGLPNIKLSPASVGAPIKGYRNSGGWGGEGLEYIVKNGVASIETWPANAIKESYDNAASQASRALHKVTEFMDVISYEQMATLLVLGFPVAIGLNWWSHEVLAVDYNPDGTVVILNSWTPTWGDEGYSTLSASKANPDDACCAFVTNASLAA